MSKKLSYKYCIVPSCRNTTCRTPNKIFLRMPVDPSRRKDWCQAIKRNEFASKPCSRHVCEDHFNLEEDMENFMRWRMMGGSIFMKKHVIPHIFDCQKSNNQEPRKARAVRRTKKAVTGYPKRDTVLPKKEHEYKKVENVSSHVKPKLMGGNLKLRKDIRPHKFECLRKIIVKQKINTNLKNVVCRNIIEQDNVKSFLEEDSKPSTSKTLNEECVNSFPDENQSLDLWVYDTDGEIMRENSPEGRVYVYVVPVSIDEIEGVNAEQIYNTEDSQQDDDLEMERDVKVKEEVGELNNDIKAEIKIEPQDADDINDLLMNAKVKQEPAEEENNDTASTILYDHIDVHETDIKIECEKDSLQSEAEMSISSQLTNNSSKDSYESKEICDSESEKVNKRTNKETENYECYICNKKYSRWFALMRHKRHHMSIPKKPILISKNIQFDPKPFTCLICKNNFRLISHLKIHQRYHFYECNICMKKFISLNLLKNHQKNHPHTPFVNIWPNYQSTSPSDSVHIQNHLVN